MSGRRPSALCRISFVNRLWLRYGSLRSGKRRMKSNIAWSMEKRACSSADGLALAPRKHHKILVLVTADPKSAMVIRRAKRVSDFLGAECFAVAVQATGDLSGLPEADREAVEQHLNFARNLHIETRILEGDDVALDVGRFWASQSGHTDLSYASTPEGMVAGIVPRPRAESHWSRQGHADCDRLR